MAAFGHDTATDASLGGHHSASVLCSSPPYSAAFHLHAHRLCSLFFEKKNNANKPHWVLYLPPAVSLLPATYTTELQKATHAHSPQFLSPLVTSGSFIPIISAVVKASNDLDMT